MLVLRDIGGEPLHAFLRRHRDLPRLARLELALKICDALAAVHAAGVVHRDIKPANIILHDDGARVQLIDFSAPPAGEGTLQYMSPEQTGRTGRAVDPRSDYYSLGATLYELLTGRPPFDSDDPLELVHAHLARVPTPPAALEPDLGDTLSQLVLRLLEKSPEARYQSLAGLHHDLARARDAVARGERPDFPLAARDRRPGLQLPATLFGRDRELAALLSVWTAAQRGARALALVAGPSGAGKSSLVRALAAAVRDGGGRLVTGRFEQVEKDIPYAGLLAALDQLLRRLLAEPEARLAAARAALQAALGEGAGALADVLPALALVVGPPPRPPDVGPAEAAGRFHAAVTRLVRAFAGPDSPLVLAVDDLQWADPATLRLLGELAREPALDHLLLIGSFRDDELADGSPLRTLAADVRVTLDPLAPADVARLVGATLGWPLDQAAPLAATISARTDNNPLFVRAYLRWLFDQGALAYSSEREAWIWDPARAVAAPDDDLVALMTRRLGALGPDAQRALQAAACIGARFTRRRLAAVLGRPEREVAEALADAIERGLVQPAGADALEFVHDKVQQAAYDALEGDERLRLHLELGRGLLRDTPPAALDDLLFEITGHLNLAAARISAADERVRLAELDLAAGRKASRAAAFATAVHHLRQGIAALPEGSWSARYPLTFALHCECMKCEHFAGDPEAAAARFAPLLARARTDLDRAEVYELKVGLDTDRGDAREALDTGLTGLALLGVRLPLRMSRLALMRELAAVRILRGRTPLRAFAELPEAHDPRIVRALKLLGSTCAAVYSIEPDLSIVYLLRALALTLRHGATGESSVAVAFYGIVHVGLLADGGSARTLHDAAYALADRFPDPRHRMRLANFCGVYLRSWLDPAGDVARQIAPVIEQALQLGEFSEALFIAVGLLHARWLTTADVDQLLATAREIAAIGAYNSGFVHQHWHIPFVHFCLALRGETLAPTSLSRPDFDEAFILANLGPHYRAFTAGYHLAKLTLLYHHGAYDEALALSERLGWARFAGTVSQVDQTTLAILVHTARGEPLRGDLARRAGRWRDHLRRWSRLCPDNVEGRLFLAEAELARCRGDHDDATVLYGRAIEAARRAGHLRIEALALERAGRHALSRSSHVLGDMYLGGAVDAYGRWGARTIVEHLRREFPRLAPARPAAPPVQPAPPPSAPSTGADDLDLAALLRSTQAITGELVLEKLLRALVRTVVEIAGARRCFVLLAHDNDLTIAAVSDVAADRLDVLQSRPMSEEPALPRSVVQFVARTRRDVVLADAAVDPDFAADPGLAGVRSVLCAPILHHGELLGVLYLDNDLAPHLFDRGRLALLRHLAAQIATSLDNARLYDDLARARDAAVSADRLKTRFILNMSHELRTPLNAVIGYAGLVRESAADGDLAAIDADTAKIERAAGRLVRTLTSILELSRLEADVVRPTHVPVDLAALVREAVAAAAPDARAHEDALVLDLAPDLGACTSDPGMLAHCVHTLVDNAVRFTRRGRVDIALRRVDIGGAAGFELRVADTGVGIAAADLPRLFVSFQPLDDAPTRAHEGSGVSLAVAQRFARLLGGAIDVASEPGRGATFTLRVPLSAA